MGGRREVSIISHGPVTSSDLKYERLFFFWCNWFTVADFLYARSYVYHYRGKRGRFVTVL